MGSINDEITRINDAKTDINAAIIASGGPEPLTPEDTIETYADRVRAIPSAVLSNLNMDPRGGIDKYIKSISQTNGIIDATLGGIVSSSESGLVPKILTATAAISNKDNEWVLSSNSGETPTWKKLPSNAFSNTNTIPSAHCSTAAGTSAKTASFTNYVATANRYFQINFTYANTYKGAITLNINSKGAKALYINGQASSSSNCTLSGGPYIAFYDGTNYYINTDGTIPNISHVGHVHPT